MKYTESTDRSHFHGQKTVEKSVFGDKSGFGYKSGEKCQIGKMKDFRSKVTKRVSENIS